MFLCPVATRSRRSPSGLGRRPPQRLLRRARPALGRAGRDAGPSAPHRGRSARAVRARILEQAEGNPFYLEEIIRSLIDGGHLFREDDRWRAGAGYRRRRRSPTPSRPCSRPGSTSSIRPTSGSCRRPPSSGGSSGPVPWPTSPGRRGSGRRRRAPAAGGPGARVLAGRLDPLRTARAALQARADTRCRLRVAPPPRSGARAPRRRSLARADRGRARRGVRGAPRVPPRHVRHGGARGRGCSPTPRIAPRRSAWLVRASRDARRRLGAPKAQRLAEQAIELAGTDAERIDALEALGETAFTAYLGDLGWRSFRKPPCCWLASSDADGERVAYLAARACETPQRWPGSMRGDVPTEAGGARRSSTWGWRRCRRATVRRGSDSSACAPDGRSVTRIPPRPSPTSFPSRKRGWRPPRSRSGWVCPTSPPARWMPRTRHGPPRVSTARRFRCGNGGRRSSRSSRTSPSSATAARWVRGSCSRSADTRRRWRKPTRASRS